MPERPNVWNREADENDRHGGEDQRMGRAPLKEWNLGRTQQMHNQSLCKQAFQEPVSMGLGYFATVCSPDVVIEPVETKCAHVNCTTSRSKHEDEAEKIFGIPFLRSQDIFFVHAIPRKSNL